MINSIWKQILVFISIILVSCAAPKQIISLPQKTAVSPTPTSSPIPFSASELQATIIARSPITYTDIIIQENLAFLGYGDYLVILDISTPSQPTLVSKTPLQNQIKRIQATGNIIYLVLEARDSKSDKIKIGLQIVDVADPLNPSVRGFYRPEFLAIDAVVIGDAAHVIGFNDNWDVVDISNPGSPTKIGTLREGWTGSCSGCSILHEIREIEGYLYLFPGNNRSDYRQEIIVYDVSNPLNPRLAREKLSYRNGSRMILDFSDPDGDAYTISPRGEGFLFRILDLSSQSYYNVVGELLLEVPGASIQSGGLVAIDHYVYFASSDGLYVIDVMERFRPSLVNTLYSKAYFSNIVKANGFVYLLDWDNGLFVLDVSDPANPVEVGKWQW